MTSRWRSGAVKLALVGAGGAVASMTGCTSSGTHHRNVYNSMADCAADYSMGICSSKGQQGAARFLGPTYRMVSGQPKSCSSQDPGGGPSWNSRKLAVERSGFGYSCRSSGRSSWSTSSGS